MFSLSEYLSTRPFICDERILLLDKLIFTSLAWMVMLKFGENIYIYLWQVDYHLGKLNLESVVHTDKLV